MKAVLRKIYEVLECFSTATHKEMCNDFLRRLRAAGEDNLAYFFATALEENHKFCEAGTSFIPEGRVNRPGKNRAVIALAKSPDQKFKLPSDSMYEFKFLNREVPPLRLAKDNLGWIDYVAHTSCKPIIGEVKYNGDQNPFYAFVQLLTYLSEMATPNQLDRAIMQNLFGESVLNNSSTFDLHIFLANFNDRGEKGPFIELTHDLAIAFKERLVVDYPVAAKCLGNVICIDGKINDETNGFSDIRCLWVA